MEMSQEFHSTAPKYLTGLRFTRSELTVYAMISFLVVLWCNYKWNRRHMERLAAKLEGPPSYPIVGSIFEFFGTPRQRMKRGLDLLKIYGPEPFKMWLGMTLAVIITKPEDLQIVLNSSKALAKDKMYKLAKNIVGEGLITAPVDKWRRHRRLITPVFNANLLEHFFPVFIEESLILIRNLKKELGNTERFDLWEYMESTALNTICQFAMSYNINTQPNKKSEFTDAMKKVNELYSMRAYNPWLYPEIIFSIYTKFKGLHNINKTLHVLPNQVIKEMKEKYSQKKLLKKSSVVDVNDSEKKSLKVFLDLLFELNEVGANFSDAEIRDEVVTMMTAGSETNAITSCFCLLMLAIHQNIQDKVYDEIYETIGDGDNLITIEEVNKLVYLEQVLKETLRLFPTLPFFLRQLEDNVKIASGDLKLLKGTTVVVSPLGTHHIAELYPNPWTFNPENFNPENVAKRHKFSFIAFSGGPRNCIGSKYAMLSMKILVSTFLRNFSVHTDIALDDIQLTLGLVIKSANGYPVTIKPRDRRPTYKQKN